MNAQEAVRLARLARAAGRKLGGSRSSDPRYLLPDPVETLAAETLVREGGFVVLPYINADLCLPSGCRRSARRPSCRWGRPSGQRGLQTRDQIGSSSEQATVRWSWMPASAHRAMPRKRWNWAPTRSGQHGHRGGHRPRMARAFKAAIEAGRAAFG
jgi:thiazole synthase